MNNNNIQFDDELRQAVLTFKTIPKPPKRLQDKCQPSNNLKPQQSPQPQPRNNLKPQQSKIQSSPQPKPKSYNINANYMIENIPLPSAFDTGDSSNSQPYGYIPGEEAPPGYPHPPPGDPPIDQQNNNQQKNQNDQQETQSFIKAYTQYMQNISTLKYRTRELRSSFPDQFTEVHKKYLYRMEKLIQKTLDVLAEEDPEDDDTPRTRSRGNSLSNSNRSASNKSNTNNNSPRQPHRSCSQRNNRSKPPPRNENRPLIRSKSEGNGIRTQKPALPPSPPIPIKSNKPHPLSQSAKHFRNPSSDLSQEEDDFKAYEMKYDPETNCYQAETIREFNLSRSAPSPNYFPKQPIKPNTNTNTNNTPNVEEELKDALLELTKLNRQQNDAIQKILLSPR